MISSHTILVLDIIKHKKTTTQEHFYSCMVVIFLFCYLYVYFLHFSRKS
ncbi:hypothetical protein HMPREF3181_01458 [Parvimonas sp. KA00067]|nr:hypothetical protein HMPREF3181_01458 [Parvimonas sp. KA00067]